MIKSRGETTPTLPKINPYQPIESESTLAAPSKGWRAEVALSLAGLVVFLAALVIETACIAAGLGFVEPVSMETLMEGLGKLTIGGVMRRLNPLDGLALTGMLLGIIAPAVYRRPTPLSLLMTYAVSLIVCSWGIALISPLFLLPVLTGNLASYDGEFFEDGAATWTAIGLWLYAVLIYAVISLRRVLASKKYKQAPA
jgi:hypothetical protein